MQDGRKNSTFLWNTKRNTRLLECHAIILHLEAGSTVKGQIIDTGLDMVVLLMHPVSHRFELLQLEFGDATKAKVSDLLVQIPLSVTEDCLKQQLYDSILDQDSTDPGKSKVLPFTPLIEAFSGEPNHDSSSSRKMVVVTRPQRISDKVALQMAKPIFTNKDRGK